MPLEYSFALQVAVNIFISSTLELTLTLCRLPNFVDMVLVSSNFLEGAKRRT
jgi:hypothetical protein